MCGGGARAGAHSRAGRPVGVSSRRAERRGEPRSGAAPLPARELVCAAERAGPAALPLLPARPLRVGVAVSASNGSWAAAEAVGLRSAGLSGSEVRVMDALLAEDTVAVLLRLLTRVPLLRNPSRQLPQLLLRRGQAVSSDNGKKAADLLPVCLNALFAQRPPSDSEC